MTTYTATSSVTMAMTTAALVVPVLVGWEGTSVDTVGPAAIKPFQFTHKASEVKCPTHQED